MKNPKDELVWQGRIHIGDEPGVYGDAAYSGLCAEFPVTIRPFDPDGTTEDITFVLEADNVHVYAGYAGHQIEVSGYEADPPSGPYKWKQVSLLTTAMTASPADVKLPSLGVTFSCRFNCGSIRRSRLAFITISCGHVYRCARRRTTRSSVSIAKDKTQRTHARGRVPR